MRIGFDAKRAFKNKSGLGNYSRDLIRGLHQQFPENDYVLFTPVGETDLLEDNYTKNLICSSSSSKDGKSYWR